MKREIKTVADVLKVPATERIDLINWENCTCPFCGAKLPSEIVGFGRDKCRQYYTCSCPTAQAAEAHNKILTSLKEEEQRILHAARELRRKEEEAKKPVTITAAEILCVATGRIIPGIEPVLADDKVCLVMKRAGFGSGEAADRLMAYAFLHNFSTGLKQAAKEMEKYVSGPKITWDTDISGKLKELCSKHGIPENITM